MKTKAFTLLLALGLFSQLQVLEAQTPNTFSGTWLQANDRCDPKPRNNSYSYRAVVKEFASALDVDISVSGGRENGELHLHYEIGGKELAYTGIDHDEFRARVRRAGESLVFDITEHERGRKIESTETWTLVDGGRGLKRVRKENDPGEKGVRLYVLERQ